MAVAARENMKCNNRFTIIFLTLAILAAAAYAHETVDAGGAGARENGGRFDYLTRYAFEQDWRYFAGHRNEEMRNSYFMAAKTEFDVQVVTFDEVLHFGVLYQNELGMGRQEGGIVLDPRDADYAVIPYFRFDRNAVSYEIGLDHSCFHLIDLRADDDGVVTYWNAVYAGAAQTLHNFPLTWEASAGYFIRKFGGLNPLILSGGHPYDYRIGANVEYRYRLRERLTLRPRNEFVMFGDTLGAVHFAGKFGINADFHVDGGRKIFGLFVDFHYEFPKALPLNSKQSLFELGLRFRY